MRIPFMLFSLLSVFFLLPPVVRGAESTMSPMEWDLDYKEADYKNFDLPTSDPTLCEDACAKDPKCMAWTYIKPNTVQGPRARCWLKHSIPEKQPNPNTVTGKKILKKG
jgi:PAN domain